MEIKIFQSQIQLDWWMPSLTSSPKWALQLQVDHKCCCCSTIFTHHLGGSQDVVPKSCIPTINWKMLWPESQVTTTASFSSLSSKHSPFQFLMIEQMLSWSFEAAKVPIQMWGVLAQACMFAAPCGFDTVSHGCYFKEIFLSIFLTHGEHQSQMHKCG